MLSRQVENAMVEPEEEESSREPSHHARWAALCKGSLRQVEPSQLEVSEDSARQQQWGGTHGATTALGGLRPSEEVRRSGGASHRPWRTLLRRVAGHHMLRHMHVKP